MKKISSQKGLTLLEVMLAIALIGTIVVLSIRVSQSWLSQRDEGILRGNVEVLFEAMGNYYHSQCGISSQSNSPQNGALVTSASPVTVTLTQLAAYLPSNWANTSANNSLVYSSPPTTLASSSYLLQFNANPAGTVNTYCTAKDCGTVTPVALPSNLSTLTWRAQVAVVLLHPAQASMLKNILGADCISYLTGSGTQVYPCESATGHAGGVLVWERLPSLASPTLSSTLWVSMPALKEFNLQYTHDQMFELNANTYINDGQSDTNEQYYLCGG